MPDLPAPPHEPCFHDHLPLNCEHASAQAIISGVPIRIQSGTDHGASFLAAAVGVSTTPRALLEGGVKHMVGTRGLVVALTLLAAACGGCGTTSRHVTMRFLTEQNLLFSPAWTGQPTSNVARQDWPSVAKMDRGTDVLSYQETIIDYQGLSNNDRDRYYRRVDSVRSGRGYR